MGYLNILVSDNTEDLIRMMAFIKYKGKKGSLGKIVDEAVKEYYEQHFKNEIEKELSLD